MKAYDFLIQCESGIASVTGSPESASRVGVSVCDIGAGLNAYGAILEALHGRHRTGRGGGIRVSLFDGMADWMTVPLLHLEHGGKAPARTGLNHAMIAPYGAYPVGDGGQMVIAIQNEREWARFCEHILGDAALTTDPRFAGHPATSREQARDGRAHRRSFWPPRHGHARGGLTRRADRLRPPQRGCGAFGAPAAPPCSRRDARRHGRDRGTPPPATATARGTTAPSAPSRRWARRARRSGGSLVATRVAHRTDHEDGVAKTLGSLADSPQRQTAHGQHAIHMNICATFSYICSSCCSAGRVDADRRGNVLIRSDSEGSSDDAEQHHIARKRYSLHATGCREHDGRRGTLGSQVTPSLTAIG